MPKYIIALLLLTTTLSVFSQQTKTTFTLAPGQASTLLGNNSMFLTFGGPGLSVTNKKVDFAIRFLASLRFDFTKDLVKPNESLRPLMGFRSQIRINKMIITPASFYFFQNKWEYAAGIGVVLNGKKSEKPKQ